MTWTSKFHDLVMLCVGSDDSTVIGNAIGCYVDWELTNCKKFCNSPQELRELCALTLELTRLRQSKCEHLKIENFAPDLLGKLICELERGNDD